MSNPDDWTPTHSNGGFDVELFWDNIGQGWRTGCECGWASQPCRRAEGAGGEYDDHLVMMEEAER